MNTRKSPEFIGDYNWFARHYPGTTARIDRLIEDIQAHPKSGIGKPEALRYGSAGLWSRRIDRKNRLIYCIEEEIELITFISCRGHYEDR